MVKKRFVIISVIVLLAAALVYTRPQTIEQRFDELDFSQCDLISGYYYVYDENDGHDKTDIKFTFTPDDPEFSEIIELFENSGFNTRLRNLLPTGTRYHSYREGDFRWHISFRFEKIQFRNGTYLMYPQLDAHNFFGELDLSFLGESVLCTVSDQDQWLADVLEIIKE